MHMMQRIHALRYVRAVVCGLTMTGLASACGGDKATAPAASVTGTWKGTLVSGTDQAVVSLTLAQAEQQVSGSGTVAVGGQTIPVTSTGSFVNPSVTLTVSSDGFEPFTYTATLSDATHMSGSLNGSGFTGETLSLAKQ